MADFFSRAPAIVIYPGTYNREGNSLVPRVPSKENGSGNENASYPGAPVFV